MIMPAQLYKEELNLLYLNTWYDEKYKYYRYWIGTEELNIPNDNYNSHHFAIIENDEIIGYIKYNVNYITKCVNGFGIISFKPNKTFGKDLLQIIDDIFNKYNMNKIEFHCANGNPIKKHYYKFIEKFGGRVVGVLKESVTLEDNTIDDEIIFELFKRDYNEKKGNKRNEKKNSNIEF